jgi:hypothetical protein
MPKQLEPIFSRQEQGVVYLFSRYWNRMREFKDKKILRIHVHFPDFTIATEDGQPEAVEFEYGLSDFWPHLNSRLRKRLRDLGCKHLYIVYWDDTGDEQELRRQIRRRFSGKVDFVCLKNTFTAVVARREETAALHPSWRFSKNGGTERSKSLYSLAAIGRSLDRLEQRGIVLPAERCDGLYRTIGFDESGSNYIECEHWRCIHLFSTRTKFGDDSIPSRLLVRPNGCEYFDGCFEMKRAFKIAKKERDDSELPEFFSKFYFYDYKENYRDAVEKWTFFVYSDFHKFDRALGKKLFKKLSSRHYRFGVRSSLMIEPRDSPVIDRCL